MGIAVANTRGQLDEACCRICFTFLRATAIQNPLLYAGCLLSDISPAHLWQAGVPPTVFESVLFSLAINKVFMVARQKTHTPRILVILLRDSAVYFGGMFGIFLTNMVITATTATARVRPATISRLLS